MTKTILFISPTGTMDNGAEISIFNLMKFTFLSSLHFFIFMLLFSKLVNN